MPDRFCSCGHAHRQHEIRSGGLFGCYIHGCLCIDFETRPDRTDLGDGRCTNHPVRCMIPGCDHRAVAQHALDVERFGEESVAGWAPDA